MNGSTAADLAGFIENGSVRNSPAEREAAAVTVAAHAADAAEGLMLLQMLGLVQDRASGKRVGRRW